MVPATRGLSPLSKQYGRALYVMLGAVGLVLLIACANVANLLLARGAAREHELAIRAALGAGRSRILRQLLVESAVLALSGAVVGVILARVTSGVLATLLSSLGATLGLPLDARVLGFTLGVAAFTGLLFGLAPAWRSALAAPHALLTRGARTTAGSHARYTPAKLLVSFQVALLLPLLAGAGLLVGTLRHLSAMDPGFNPRQIVLMTVDAQHAGSLAKTQRPQAYQDILTRLRAIPGVTSASASDVTPIGNRFWNEVVAVAGYSPRTIDDSIMDFNEVSSGYFATLQSPVVLGRDFTAADGAGAPRVAIVNEAAVRKFFGGRNPLGQLMRTVGGATPAPPIHIVGVVKDAKYQTLREDAPPTAYVSLRQDDQYDSQFNFELRAPSGLEAVRASALAAVKDVNPGITASFTTLSEQVSSSLALERLLVRLSTTFGALALVLAMIGLYGVMSYSVIRRRAEIGIRMALGAGQRRVAAMILREVAVVLVAGLITGLGFASASTRLIASFLYGLDPMDLGTLMGSMALLAVVALAAAYVPARRAASVDPMDALREE